jgi:hypothetical protein
LIGRVATAHPAHLIPSTDATLSALTVNVGTLSPAFDAVTLAYTVNQVIGRSIEITGAEGIITLTNLMGVSQKYVSKGSLNIPVSNSGVYILTINNASYKVLVK